jgi:hypothetical protein
MFAGEPRYDIESGFEGALKLLKDMAETSAQAKFYHDVLNSFSETVTLHRQRVTREVQSAVQDYMERVLVVRTTQSDKQRERDVNCVTNLADFEVQFDDPIFASELDQFESLFYTIE